MKIESSNIQMAAQTTQQKTLSVSEQLEIWVDKNAADANKTANAITITDSLSLASSKEVQAEALFELSPEDENKIKLLNKLLESLTGKKFKFVIPKAFFKRAASNQPTYEAPSPQQAQPQQRQGWGLSYQKHESYSEQASLSFEATGTIKTADGKSISLQLNLNMSRSFASESHLSIKAGDALIDPLVINYDGSGVSLDNQKISFDIDNDGKENSISFVKNGSGFLAFDKNKDGIINNGSELFGPASGDGFLELSAFDSDQNMWIDENDEIYNSLRIWTKDENGNDQLFALGEKGVGAIFLGSLNTPYELKSSSNELHGKIQKTGIFLKEDGGAGTIHHVDLSV